MEVNVWEGAEATDILGHFVSSNEEINRKPTLKSSYPVLSSCRIPCKLLWPILFGA